METSEQSMLLPSIKRRASKTENHYACTECGKKFPTPSKACNVTFLVVIVISRKRPLNDRIKLHVYLIILLFSRYVGDSTHACAHSPEAIPMQALRDAIYTTGVSQETHGTQASWLDCC